MSIYERLLRNCCPDSPIDIEEHAQLILVVVGTAKKRPKR